jgi:hypothetical protein
MSFPQSWLLAIMSQYFMYIYMFIYRSGMVAVLGPFEALPFYIHTYIHTYVYKVLQKVFKRNMEPPNQSIKYPVTGALSTLYVYLHSIVKTL